VLKQSRAVDTLPRSVRAMQFFSAAALAVAAGLVVQARGGSTLSQGGSRASASLGAFSFDSGSASPVVKVVQLLHDLEATIQSDGKVEQQSYDQNACWCEDTLARKAQDISDAKTQVKELQASILDLEAAVATHGADIDQFKKDIKANEAAQKDASDVRARGHSEYENEKTEAEQSIGALQAAITVLTGAGTGGKQGGFLETTREARLLKTAGGVSAALQSPLATRTLSTADLRAVERFLDGPLSPLASAAPRRSGGRGAMGALQVTQNPFGDYAPQSTRIQGILKGLYDAFTSSLEKANAEEAEEQKAFDGLMATKKTEHATLKATLALHSGDKATKAKDLAESKQRRDDTQAQLKADEAFFAEATTACRGRATQWAERSRLRTEELQGIAQAIDVLASPVAKSIFENATTTLLQLEAVGAGSSGRNSLAARRSAAAGSRLRETATKLHGAARATKLLNIARRVEAGGHFDSVIVAIDSMIEVLRREEQDDVAHRDRCQGSQNKNTNDMEDLSHAIGKASNSIQRMKDKADDLRGEIAALEEAISATKNEMAVSLKLRNKEAKEFSQALKDDMDAIALLDKAIVLLSAFYKRNRISMAFMQRRQEPEYTINVDSMPKADWKSHAYEGRRSESSPIISMIAGIKEKLQNEISVARTGDATAQADFEKERGAARASVKALTTTKVAAAGELAELASRIEETKAHRDAKSTDLDGEKALKEALYKDCSWVDTHFESRRAARKTEMDGLVDAKNFLAGVETEA